MEFLLQDIRYGFRTLINHRGVTLVALAVLGLGIGANTAIFSAVNAVLLRPLSYPDPGRLMMIWENHQRRGGPEREWTSAANFFDWRVQSRSFKEMAALGEWRPTLTQHGDPEQLNGARVSHPMFSALGVAPAVGRGFLEEEDRPGGQRSVILGYGLWQRRFGLDPGITGKTLILNGLPHTVVGVMPAGFKFPVIPGREIWTPLQASPGGRGNAVLRVIGRLRDGVTEQQAQSELNAIASRLEQQYPESNSGAGVALVSLHEQLTGNVRRSLWILLASVGFVLLIASANVANLLLARAAARRKEIGIRIALGVSQARLVRQILVEGALLAVLGGSVGLALAFLVRDFLAVAIPPELGHTAIRLDRWVFGFTAAVSVLTGLGFGLAPALHARSLDVNEALKEGGRRAAGTSHYQAVRRSLVVSEVALTLMLLSGAGLLLRTFLHLQRVDLGFNPVNLLALNIFLPRASYGEDADVRAFFSQLIERIKTRPGVRSAAATSTLPLSGDGTDMSFMIEGRPLVPGQAPVAWYSSVTPDFHEAMGIALLKGRTLTAQDNVNAPAVVVINETMARRYWPDQDPVGRRIGSGNPRQPRWREIVGVVSNVKFFGLDQEQPPAMYVPLEQAPSRAMTVVVRTGTEPIGLLGSVRQEVWALDKTLAAATFATMEQLLADSLLQRRLVLTLLGAFAAIALVLAAVGLYGLMAYTAAQRTQEIGIRMALGAQSHDVMMLVLREGLFLAVSGVAVGLTAALALTRFLSTLLVGVSATDPATFTGVSGVLVAVALLASYLPARRATRVDPMVALRHE